MGRAKPPKHHQPRLGHPQDEQGWKKASLCLSLLALPCSTISRATLQSPPSSRAKNFCGNLSLSPTGAKTLKWRGLGFLPHGTWAEPPTPILLKYFSYVTCLLPPNTAQISPKTRPAQ